MKPKIIQLFFNERWDKFAVLDNGKVYKSRHIGITGDNYAPWIEQDVIGEIEKDTKK